LTGCGRCRRLGGKTQEVNRRLRENGKAERIRLREDKA